MSGAAVAVVEPRPEQAPKLPTIQAGGAVRAIVPQDFDSAWRIANAVCTAEMAPRGLETPAKAMVAIMHGLEVGLTPMNALQSIAVVNGRPTIYGDGAIGLVRASGLLEWMEETFEGAEATDAFKAVCLVKRKGEPKPIRGEFSIADAKRASLFGKAGPWQQYLKRMLQMRARAFTLRDAFADVLKGLSIREEVDDYPIRDVTPREEPPAPPPAPQTTAKVVEAAVVEDAPAVAPQQEAPANAAAPAAPPEAEPPKDTAPDPDKNPEAFLKWCDDRLKQVSDPEELSDVFNAEIEPYRGGLFPPDDEVLMATYKRHENRLGID